MNEKILAIMERLESEYGSNEITSAWYELKDILQNDEAAQHSVRRIGSKCRVCGDPATVELCQKHHIPIASANR